MKNREVAKKICYVIIALSWCIMIVTWIFLLTGD
jgi:hypothetical protein